MSDENVDVLVAMNNFAALGVQRVFIEILKNWPTEGPPIGLSVHTAEGEFESYFEKDVPVFELDEIQRPIPGVRPPFRVLAYYRLLKRLEPETVIAVNQFEALALCLVKRLYSDFDLIVSENCHVTSNIKRGDAHSGWFGWFYRNRFSYEYTNYADVVHTVAEEAAEDLIENHGIPADLVKVIYNPVDIEEVRRRATESNPNHPWLSGDNNTVIAVARLTEQKRIDVLLDAWAQVKSAEPDDVSHPYRLIIGGDGYERENLEQQANELGIKESVDFVGFLENPWSWIREARLFVSTSEWEGLPLTLIETQVVGTPIVASSCPSGPSEILLDGEAGFLFETNNVEQCAERIVYALESPGECQERVEVGRENLDRFAVDNVVEQYLDIV